MIYKVLILLILSGFSNFLFSQNKENLIEQASPEKFKAYIESLSKPLVIDVNDSLSRIHGYIKGSVWAGNEKQLKAITDTLDHENLVLVYCEKGVRSMQVCKILEQEGFKKIVNLEKGLISWKKSKFETLP